MDLLLSNIQNKKNTLALQRRALQLTEKSLNVKLSLNYHLKHAPHKLFGSHLTLSINAQAHGTHFEG